MDFFGQKTKKLFVKNTNADRTSIRFLEAMSRKLERDYLPLFNKLIFEYKKGNIKKESQKAADLVSATILRLNTVIGSGIISDEDEKLILSNVEQIEQYKKLLIDSASKTISFRKRLERIEKETGVSVEDLTISKSIAKKAVGKARGGPSASKFAAKKVGGYAGERAFELAQSITTGLLGPFGFIMEDVFKGLKSVARYSKLQRRRKGEEKTLSALKEHSVGAETSLKLLRPDVFKRVTGQPSARRETSGLGYEKLDVPPYFRVKSKRKDQDTALEPREAKERPFLKIPEMGFAHDKLLGGGLFHFFNKDAYRAKWTSELLKAVKGRHGEYEGTGFNLFGLLGKAGLLAALATAIGLTIDQLNKLKNAGVDLEKSRDKERAAADSLGKSLEKQKEVIEGFGGIETYAKKVGSTPRKIAVERVGRQQRVDIERYNARPWYARIGFESSKVDRLLDPMRHKEPFEKRVEKEQEKLSKKELIDVPARQSVEDITKRRTEREVRLSGKKSGVVVPSYKRGTELQKDIVKTRDLSKLRPEEDHTKEVVSEVKKLNKNFEDWYKKLGMSKSSISAAGIRNVNDSSDSMLRQFNGSDGLSVGD